MLLIISACGTKDAQSDNEKLADENQIEETNDVENVEELDVDSDKEEKTSDKDEKEQETSDKQETKIEKKSNSNEEMKQTASSNEQRNTQTKPSKETTSGSKKTSSNKNTTKKSENTSNKTSTNQSNNHAAPPKNETEKVEQTVTVSVSIPSGVSKGSGLSATTVTINDGDTVLDATKRAGVSVDSTGSGSRAYVRGINGLKEFDEGPMSGWLIKVDGVTINKSAGAYKLKDKQKIEWVYTTDYTK